MAYVAPNWKNGQAPALDATALQAISDAIVANQTKNTQQDSSISSLQTSVNGKSRVATGSYTGTGTYGVNNPNSITFPFTPKLVIIFGSKNPNLSGFVNQVVSCFDTNNAGGGTNNRVVLWSEIPTSYSSTQNGPFIGDFDYQKDTYRNVSRAKKSGNTLSWYCGAESTWNNVSTYGPYSQLNISNVKYYWIAFG